MEKQRHALHFAVPSIQRFSAVFPDATVQPLVLKIPVEFRTLYAASKLTPDDVLTFGYQIASGMVSTPTYLYIPMPIPTVHLLHGF